MTFEDWLALREPADAAARSRELVEQLPATGSHVVHDLGCGTGSMGRWLAPQLRGPQHWVLHDRDADLLEAAVTNPPARATVEPRQSDITRLDPADLAGATLITGSALLDMLTAEDLGRLVNVCASAGCPILLTLTVVGRVELTPAHPLDRRAEAAFNAHQRRRTLGPDAAAQASRQFSRLGAEVVVRPSPWRLGHEQADLTAEWFDGWLRAACEQEAELTAETETYKRRRLEQAMVHHVDLLVLPRSGG